MWNSPPLRWRNSSKIKKRRKGPLLSWRGSNERRAVQEERYRPLKGRPRTNAHLTPKDVKRFCALSTDGRSDFKAAIERLGLSARAFDRIRKVSRTISDLEGCAAIAAGHVAEAINYRRLDRPNN